MCTTFPVANYGELHYGSNISSAAAGLSFKKLLFLKSTERFHSLAQLSGSSKSRIMCGWEHTLSNVLTDLAECSFKVGWSVPFDSQLFDE